MSIKLTISWADGEQRTVENAIAFNRQWVGDEYLVVVTKEDESEEHFTGREIAVVAGSLMD